MKSSKEAGKLFDASTLAHTLCQKLKKDRTSFLGLETRTAVRAVKCSLCKKRYPRPKKPGTGVLIAMFGQLTLAECCFPNIEEAIFVERERVVEWVTQRGKEVDKMEAVALAAMR